MAQPFEAFNVKNGDPVHPEQVTAAVTAAEFVYDDGATQTFERSGATTYVEGGRPTSGEWYVDAGGRFCSFWPPSYRACYDLSWIVEGGTIVGIRFTDARRATQFDGRYR